jgi:hypothetical protein
MLLKMITHSSHVLQQTNESIATNRPGRDKGPRSRLIEECNFIHYALSYVEHVKHDSKPATY